MLQQWAGQGEVNCAIARRRSRKGLKKNRSGRTARENEVKGMDRPSLAIFIHELRNQCFYTEAAFNIFNQSLQQQSPSGTFLAAHAVLMNASQIAALLWPTRARSKKRGEALREILQLPEKHALNDRRIVEIWEHNDEKLEEWIGATKGQHVIFDHIGPLEGFTEFPVAEGNIYRMYDTNSLIFYYRGDGYKLKALAEAISEIYSRASAVHRQMLPEQHTTVPAASQAIREPRSDQTEAQDESAGEAEVEADSSTD